MSNAMLDARQEDDSYRRIELITGQRRRRRWTAQEKARIVAESFEEGANISEVARRNGVVRGLLTVWRHKLATAADEPGHLPPAHTRPQEMVSPPGRLRGVIEIEMSGVRIRVEPGVDAPTLSTVLSALRGGR